MKMQAVLERSAAEDPAYPGVGATRAALLDGGALPDGWNHVRHRLVVGHGEADLQAAADCVLSWGMHRGAGMRVLAQGPRARAGTTVVVGIGAGPVRLLAPCRVVWTADEPHRRGFGYATLPGHPAQGEEAFLVELDAGGTVTFTIAAFSRPARWYFRLVSPLFAAGQQVAARAFARSVRRAAGRRPGHA